MTKRAARRRRLGEHVQQVRPDLARSAATRSPASAARAACTGSKAYVELVVTCSCGSPRRANLKTLFREAGRPDGDRDKRATRSASPGRPKDLQALHRRRVRAHRVGPLRPDPVAEEGAPRQRLARLAQGRARRRPQGARGAARLGVEDRIPARADPLPHGGDARGTRRSRSRSSCARAGASPPPPRGAKCAPRSTGSSTTPAGPTSTARSSRRSIPSRRRTSTSRCRSPTGVVGVVAPETPDLLGLVSLPGAR